MATPPVGHITNIYGFISTSTRPKTAKYGRMVDQHELYLLANDSDVTTYESRDKHMQLYSHFWKKHYHQAWQNVMPTCPDFHLPNLAMWCAGFQKCHILTFDFCCWSASGHTKTNWVLNVENCIARYKWKLLMHKAIFVAKRVKLFHRT